MALALQTLVASGWSKPALQAVAKVLVDAETNPVIGFKVYTSQLLPLRLLLLASELD